MRSIIRDCDSVSCLVMRSIIRDCDSVSCLVVMFRVQAMLAQWSPVTEKASFSARSV
jgi:hypothetical protein